MGDDPDDPLQAPDLAGGDHLAHLPVNAVRALVEHHPEQRAALCGSRVHPRDLFGIYPRGLVAEDMDAPFQAFFGYFGMQIVRRLYEHRIAKPGIEHFPIIGKIADAALSPLSHRPDF